MTLVEEPETEIDLPELRFPGGLPGFPGEERFALVRWGGDDSPFSVLRSLTEEGPDFLVVPPHVFFPDYAPEVDDDTVDALGVEKPEDVLLLVIVSVGEQPRDSTANLLGPLVINLHTRTGAQTVLTKGGYEARRPLVAA